MILDRERLKALIKARGYTQESLSEAIGYSSRQGLWYFMDKDRPDPERVKKICTVLNADVLDFMTLEPHEEAALKKADSAASIQEGNIHPILSDLQGQIDRLRGELMRMAETLRRIEAGGSKKPI